MSRIEEISVPNPIPYDKIALAQLADVQLQTLLALGKPWTLLVLEALKTPLRPLSNGLQKTAVYIPQNLFEAEFVFVLEEAVKDPLGRAYKGPFKVIRPQPKFFTLLVNQREDTVSIDWLKPAFVSNLSDEPVTAQKTAAPSVLKELLVNQKEDTVSMDRLKSAFVCNLSGEPVTAQKTAAPSVLKELLINQKEATVSMDPLKPAFVCNLSGEPVTAQKTAAPSFVKEETRQKRVLDGLLGFLID